MPACVLCGPTGTIPPRVVGRPLQVEIVEELLAYLAVADFAMREELVLKTAVLAERWVTAGWCLADLTYHNAWPG